LRPLEARVCRPSEWADALRLLYTHLTPDEREEHVRHLVASGERGEIKLNGLIACWQGDQVVGSLFCIPSPGRSIVAWPPKYWTRVPADELVLVRRALFRGMRAYAVDEKARLAQVLLSAEEQGNADALIAEGFFHLAHLIYLRRPSGLRPLPEPRADVEYVCYAPELRQDFMQVLESSYEESLDCPQLTGARSMEDILDSHRAQGVFDPHHWFLMRREGTWVGCLLLAGLPEYNAIEVAYIAVLKGARARGLGRELLHHAIRVAEGCGVDILTLAVDSRNTPARRMYEAEGFSEWDHRDAYLLVLDPADGNFDRARLAH
jgi:ribosomal protein S18 acetylase RimI-like enzyme